MWNVKKNGTSINEIVKGIEILGDNLDVTITPAKMTADCQRKSLHWFLTMVKEKKITFHDMPKVTHERCQSILELPTTSWMPTSGDIEGFHENLVFHVSHILVKYIDFLKPVACCLPEYIEHPYIEKTKERSVVLNSDLIDASENCAQGMITILQKIHELGVPKLEVGENKRVIERVVFGGDVLTNERAFSAQEAMQTSSVNNKTDYDSLYGLIHRPEGLQRQMNFLLVYAQLAWSCKFVYFVTSEFSFICVILSDMAP